MKKESELFKSNFVKKFKDTSKIRNKKQSSSSLKNKSCKDMSKIFKPKSQNWKKNSSI